jgi:integrase/recombinase XerD
MTPPSVRYDDFRRIKDEDIDKIFASIVLNPGDSFLLRRDTMMVAILLYCGIRRGELIALKVIDIDQIKSMITINGETSKSKRSRTLRLGPKLLLHIKDYLKERNRRGLKTEYLLASCRGDDRLTDHGLKHWVKALIKRSGVNFHLHRFRHTFACRLVEKNVNAFSIQYLMGHSSILMTMRYVRSIMTENMIDEIDKISY